MELKELKNALEIKLGKLVEKIDDESQDKDKLYKEISLVQGALKRTNELIDQERSKFNLDPIKAAEQAQKVEELNFKKEQASKQEQKDKKDRIIEIIKVVASIVVPVTVSLVPWAIWKHGMTQSILYEESGNYTTAFGKNLINMKPKI